MTYILLIHYIIKHIKAAHQLQLIWKETTKLYIHVHKTQVLLCLFMRYVCGTLFLMPQSQCISCFYILHSISISTFNNVQE